MNSPILIMFAALTAKYPQGHGNHIGHQQVPYDRDERLLLLTWINFKLNVDK